MPAGRTPISSANAPGDEHTQPSPQAPPERGWAPAPHEALVAVERLSPQVQHVSEREERVRDVLVLRLENSILRGRQALLVGEADAGG